MDIASVQSRLREFVEERDWAQYHSPKNLSMALAVEASELMEIFQWVGSEESRNVIEHPEELRKIEDEVADVFVYTLRIADVLGIDLEKAVWAKIEKNANKYPSEVEHRWSL
jgi:NTP pyrophosphatase (non-canonical NTP hydrolase)